MAPRIDDRWLWLGFAAFAFCAAKGIHYALQDVFQLTKIDPYQYESKRKEEEFPEDTIDLEHLKTLALSPNVNIANAARSLITARLSRVEGAWQSITKDTQSRDGTISKRARLAVDFLHEYPLPAEMGYDPLSHSGFPVNGDEDDYPSPLDTDAMEEMYSRTAGGGLGIAHTNSWTGRALEPSPANPIAGWTNVPRERPVDDDDNEAERRRRRREAVVVRDGEGEVEEGDIIRPRPWTGI